MAVSKNPYADMNADGDLTRIGGGDNNYTDLTESPLVMNNFTRIVTIGQTGYSEKIISTGNISGWDVCLAIVGQTEERVDYANMDRSEDLRLTGLIHRVGCVALIGLADFECITGQVRYLDELTI